MLLTAIPIGQVSAIKMTIFIGHVRSGGRGESTIDKAIFAFSNLPVLQAFSLEQLTRVGTKAISNKPPTPLGPLINVDPSACEKGKK